MAVQYGLLPSEQENVSYPDWVTLVGGLMPSTPLGEVIKIRSENNQEVLKNFTPNQNKIRNEWMSFKTKKFLETADDKEIEKQMNDLYAAMRRAFG